MNRKGINKPYLLFCFLLFLVAISYSNTLYSPFVLDDLSAFVDNGNLYLQDLSSESLANLAQTRFGYARVIPIATFALNHYIGQGKSIANYHVTNILIHVLATISVFFLLAGLLKTRAATGALRFFRAEYFVLGVCAFWALSPVQTNAVTYLVQRMTSLSALFYIAACGLYVHARLSRANWKRIILYVFFLLSALLAFFSKENSATLPAALLLVECMFISPHLGPKLVKVIKWYHILVILIGLILISPAIVSFVSNQVAGFQGRHFTVSERMLTELRIIIFYMSLLLLPLPSRMNLEHDFLLSTSLFSPFSTFLSLMLIVGLLAGALFTWRKYPFISFGILWFFLNLLIESSFIPLELIFEHRLYLPSVGFFLAFVSASDHLFAKYVAASHPEIKKIVFLFLIILLSISSILTSLRNNDWRDKLSIYEDSMEKSPAKPRAVSNYAMSLGKAGQYDECVKYGLKVQSLGVQGYEDYMNSATNVLTCLILQDKSKEAVETGEEIKKQILQKNLEYIAAGAMHKYMFNLAKAYTLEKKYRKAYETFMVSLFRAPYDNQTYIAINELLVRAQDDELGRKDLNLGEHISEIPLRLAEIAYNYRQYDYAAQYLNHAVKAEASPEVITGIKEKYANTVKQNKLLANASNIRNDTMYKNNMLFRWFMKAADYILRKYRLLQGAPAGWLLNQAQKIDPGNPYIPIYRARWLMANNQEDVAINELEEYIETNNNFVPALELLAICYQKKENYAKSVSILRHILDIYHGHSQWINNLSYIYENEDRDAEHKRSPLEYY